MLAVLKKEKRFIDENLLTFPPGNLMLVPVFMNVIFVPVKPVAFMDKTFYIHESNVYYDNTQKQLIFQDVSDKINGEYSKDKSVRDRFIPL
jgi:hypothetical protein